MQTSLPHSFGCRQRFLLPRASDAHRGTIGDRGLGVASTSIGHCQYIWKPLPVTLTITGISGVVIANIFDVLHLSVRFGPIASKTPPRSQLENLAAPTVLQGFALSRGSSILGMEKPRGFA
jgi:hypothetical protein